MLESFTLKNFRSCENASIRLDEPVVALVGKNGVGKTNLLHAIQLAVDLCVGQSRSPFAMRPRKQSASVDFQIAFTVNGTRCEYVTKRSGGGISDLTLEESLVAGNTTLFRREDESIRAEQSLLPELSVGVGTSALPALLQLLPRDNPLIKQLRPIAEYLQAIRYQPLIQGFQEHVSGPSSMRGMGEFMGDASPFIEVARYEAWKTEQKQGHRRRSVQLRLLDLSLTDKDGFQEVKTLLGENGLGLIEDIQIEEITVLRSRHSEATAEEQAYSISFTPCGGLAGAGQSFRYSGLSAGTWRVVQLITYLIYDKYSCMLVEQPEDSIHAGLLAKVIDILQTYSGHTQLICTTHSPRVMNLVGPRGIRFVTATNGQTSVSELTPEDLGVARQYLEAEGTLSEFLETLGSEEP